MWDLPDSHRTFHTVKCFTANRRVVDAVLLTGEPSIGVILIPFLCVTHRTRFVLTVCWLVQTSVLVFLPSLFLFLCPLFPSMRLVCSFSYCTFLKFLNFCCSLSPVRKLSPCLTDSALDITCWHSFTPLFILPPSQFVISKNGMFAFLSHLSKPELYLIVETVVPVWNFEEWPTEYQSWCNKMWMNL